MIGLGWSALINFQYQWSILVNLTTSDFNILSFTTHWFTKNEILVEIIDLAQKFYSSLEDVRIHY